jgi:hypothetical protein
MSVNRSMKKRLSKSTGEKGVTMVEFSLSLTFFILLLGALFDIGLAIHNWMLLRTVTLEATRNIAISLVTNPDCAKIQSYLLDTATPRLRNDLGADAPPNKLYWNTQWIAGNGTFPTLAINAHFPVQCYFLCQMFPGGFSLSATSETVLEVEQMAPCDNLKELES